MRHFIAQFGPCLKWPWTKLIDVPDFDDALVELIAGQSDAQSGHLRSARLERIRDDNLVAILQALKADRAGAPASCSPTTRQRLFDAGARIAAARPRRSRSAPPTRTGRRRLDRLQRPHDRGPLPAGLRRRHRRLLRLIGVDADYIAERRLATSPSRPTSAISARPARRPRSPTDTQVIDGTTASACTSSTSSVTRDGRLLATGEHMLLHVSLAEPRRLRARPATSARSSTTIAQAARERCPRPRALGRAVGQPQD